ncbi:16S rRNA (cytidine(1402)-2'-O)-methyltransferase [Rickettsiaceae bacterium]|nr:16S rRNA (cytidine(1402)-2'-O)-methyltransferase [Rickettsiaceae bacterium]
MSLKPGLYIVSTPIGNLGDITLRALETLKGSDIVLCEDTRVSNKLLAKHNIKASLKLYNDNSDEDLRIFIKELIESGKIVSLVSDAGTPLISDPGYKLVRDLKQDNIHIDVVPGTCAAIAALSMSGLPTDKFFFAGFLPKTEQGRRNIFVKYQAIDASLIFYDTANRLLDSLEVALNVFGDVKANVAREITKLFQESKSGKLSELVDYYQKNPARGEIVLTISAKDEAVVSEESLNQEIADLLNAGHSARDASDAIYAKYKKQFARKEVYKLVNALKKANME